MPAERPRNGARPYHRSGHYAASRALPEMMARITDATVPDDALSPVEQAARDTIRNVVADLGGIENVSTAKHALLNAAVGSLILLSSLDRYVFELAARDGLVNRRSRRAFPIIEQRMRVADSLARQIQIIGLDPVKLPTQTLDGYIASAYGSQDGQREPEHDEPSATRSPRTPIPRERGASTPEESTRC